LKWENRRGKAKLGVKSRRAEVVAKSERAKVATRSKKVEMATRTMCLKRELEVGG